MKKYLIPTRSGFGVLSDFRREMDGLLSQFLGEEGAERGDVARWTPRLNVAESESAYEVTLDAPGMKTEDFDIELHHGDLWISGQRHEEAEEQGRTWHRVERFTGQFRRAVRLGDDVDPENVEAAYTDGVLTINVPKSEASKAKKISVKS